MEIWKKVRNYPKYEVSSLGRVRSSKAKRIKSFWLNVQGYQMVTFTYDKNIHKSVASVVIETFRGPRKDNFVIDHIDGNKFNNKVENLEFVKQRNNIQRYRMRKTRELPLGVSRHLSGKSRPYVSNICVKGKSHRLGYFSTIKEAVAAYRAAEYICEKYLD